MKLTYEIIIALGLDMLIGDPRLLPHPVRLIGRFAESLEDPLRRALKNARMAGVTAAFLVVAATASVTWAAIRLAALLHPIAGEALSVYVLYSAFAARDLRDHAMNVHDALATNDLTSARRLVSMMVGRDTDQMDERAVARAAVESVAENSVDGVVAPLFYAALFGPVGAMFYKAVNTLDSTFGYKNKRYIDFGWASAGLDDLANYIPARLTALLMMLSVLPGGKAAMAYQICSRDGRRHASPNSGLAEATMAGALSIQLGGPVLRGGIPQDMPIIGAPAEHPEARHIPMACAVMLTTTLLAAAALIAARLGIMAMIR